MAGYAALVDFEGKNYGGINGFKRGVDGAGVPADGNDVVALCDKLVDSEVVIALVGEDGIEVVANLLVTFLSTGVGDDGGAGINSSASGEKLSTSA